MKKIIYDSFDYLDIFKDIKADPRQYPVFEDLTDEEIEDLSDERIWEEAHIESETNLECEVENLNHGKGCLASNMVAIGTLEMWNGSRRAYKMLKSIKLGDAILEVMRAFDGDNRFVVYVDDKEDVVIKQTGHDNPTNPSVMVIRYVTENALKRFDNAEEAIYQASDKAIARRTGRFGDAVCDIYGWKKRRAA